MRQKFIEVRLVSDSQLKRIMTNYGWNYDFKRNLYFLDFDGIILIIQDLCTANATILNGELFAFDPRLSILK